MSVTRKRSERAKDEPIAPDWDAIWEALKNLEIETQPLDENNNLTALLMDVRDALTKEEEKA